ncbi:hypothetical protein LUZ60_009931 [Juncus effusus]|nr:hypothetical protein LUZ60_009931 [Juncus effusus]
MGGLFQSEEIQVMLERNNLSSEEKMQVSNNNLDPPDKIYQSRKMCNKLRLEINRLTKSIARIKEEATDGIAKKTQNLVKLGRLNEELDEINVEEMFVEFSIGDEKRELREIKAKREAEAIYFKNKTEKVRNEIRKINEKLERDKGIEAEFTMINHNVFALRNELEFIKSTEISSQKNMLESIKLELENSKRELTSLKEEGFENMAQMDETRDKKRKIAEKYEEIVELENETNEKSQNLISDLHSGMAELKSISMAEKRSNGIVSNLSTALNQFQLDKDEAKREKERTDEEIKAIREEIIARKMNKKSQEERLEESLKELEKAKESEALAIQKLSKIADYTMKERAILSAYSSTITLSKSEYQYLINKAKLAEEIADKKVAASQSWIEALKAREKEISLNNKLQKPKQDYEIKETDKERNNNNSKKEEGKERKKDGSKLKVMPRKKSINLRRAKVRRPSISSERGGKIRRPSISPERVAKFSCGHPLMAGRRNFVSSVMKSLRGRTP